MRSALHLASHRADQGRERRLGRSTAEAGDTAGAPPAALASPRPSSIRASSWIGGGVSSPLAFVGPCSIHHARGTGRPALQVSRPAREDDESAGGRPRFPPSELQRRCGTAPHNEHRILGEVGFRMPDARCDLGAATQRSYGNPGQSDRNRLHRIEKAWTSAASDKNRFASEVRACSRPTKDPHKAVWRSQAYPHPAGPR